MAGIKLRGSSQLAGFAAARELVVWRGVLWMLITVPVAISQNQYQQSIRRGQHIAERVFYCRRLQQLLLSRLLGKGLFP